MPSHLFINGKIWQPVGSFSESFGINNNHFDFTGRNSEASLFKNNYQKITDLEGRLVLPGLIDGHVHLVYGSLMRKRLDCSNVNNIDELKQNINKYMKKNPGLKWIIGSNLNLEKVFAGFLPPFEQRGGRGVLADALQINLPLFITNYDYHSCICNSSALESSGLISKLNDFNDDEIPKDNSGNLTGILREKALNYIFDNIPEPGLSQKVEAVEEMISILHSYGITSVSDITDIEDFEVYKEILPLNKGESPEGKGVETGKLKIRINSYIPFKEFSNLEKYKNFTKEINPDLFTIKGFKAYYDGALSSETALFSENYKNKSHNGYKTEMAESGEIYTLSKQIDKAGMQVIMHAIGDKAVSEVLDLCQLLNNENGKRDRRFRIEHAQHIKEKDYERFKNMNAIASVQPVHLKYDAEVVKEKLSENLVNYTHNYNKLIDLGVTVNFGTDFPIVGINPFENIMLAVTRKTKEGIFTPQFKISLNDCIKGYTINNAFASFNNKTGSIQKGKFADFVIMENDLFEMNEDEISNAKVWKTFFQGEEVYTE